MPCKQKSFELVKEGVFETSLRPHTLDSVLMWHVEASIVICKYWVLFSSRFPLILNDWVMYLFIFNLGKPFPLWLLPVDECLPGLLLRSHGKTGSFSTFLALTAHIHQTKWLHFSLMQLLVLSCQNSLCKAIWRHFELEGSNSSRHGFYCRFHVYKQMVVIPAPQGLRFPQMVKFYCLDKSLFLYFLSCFGICGIHEQNN